MFCYRLASDPNLSRRISAICPVAGVAHCTNTFAVRWTRDGHKTFLARLQCFMPSYIFCDCGNPGPVLMPSLFSLIFPAVKQPARPMPIMHVHSVDDPRALYNGGQGPPFPFTKRAVFHSPVEEVLHRWVRFNSCNPQAIATYVRGAHGGYFVGCGSG